MSFNFELKTHRICNEQNKAMNRSDNKNGLPIFIPGVPRIAFFF